MGFDAVVEQPFTGEFSSRSAEDFVEHILVERLHASCVVTGYDFHFGKGRRGTPEFLQKAGKDAGFTVTLVDAFTDEGANLVSSTRIRNLLCEGDVVQAAGLLGYRYMACGEVIHGRSSVEHSDSRPPI